MKNTSKVRMLASVLLPLAIGATIAGCGDDETKSGASAGNTAAQSTPATKPAASAGAVDQAFVRQMIPHHQMAVEMAKIAQTNGEHAEIKDLADDIVAAQNKEIDELTKIADELGVTADKPMGHSDAGMTMADDAEALGLTMDQMGMSMDMHALTEADPFDKAFIAAMTPHHEGAIAMAKAQLSGGEDADLKKISTAIVAAQEKEIAEMAAWNQEWYGAPVGSGASSPGADDMSEMHSSH